MTKVYSFDIFDTLLLRPYIDPQELWTVLEGQEGAKGFAKSRREADTKTYEEAIARDGETSIDAAYALMPKKFSAMQEKEMALERKVLTANPEMIELWNKAKEEGCRRIIISDMYLPLDFITNVLEEKGISGWDTIYLSSDRGVRKSSGRLYKMMLEELQVKPEEVLHIGDNCESDVRVPGQLGIKSKHYKKVSERFFDLCPFARYIDNQLAGVLALGWHIYSCKKRLETGLYPTYWNRLGFTMGGVLGYMYVSWIVETARQLGKRRLLFVARDGYIWKKICNDLYPEIETEYIYAPRITSIVVLGAIGNDPIAIKDRKDYIERNFKDINRESIAKDYSKYIAQYNINDECALVDGCSSGFSAQSLIEKCIDKPVFSFYLSTSARKKQTASFFATNHYTLPFQHFVEFIFSAPENPIIGIKKSNPIYENVIHQYEAFKISKSQEICESAVASAILLQTESIRILPRDWFTISNTFMMNLTSEDYENLIKAQNAGDIEQRSFCPIVWIPLPQHKICIKLISKGHLFISIYEKCFFIEIHISRHGINIKKQNTKSWYKHIE